MKQTKKQEKEREQKEVRDMAISFGLTTVIAGGSYLWFFRDIFTLFGFPMTTLAHWLILMFYATMIFAVCYNTLHKNNL